MNETSKPREAGARPPSLSRIAAMPDPARGCFRSFNPHNNPRRLLLRAPCLGKGQGEGGGMPLVGVTCAFQKPTRGLGVASEVLARPSAQVPLPRGPQRDPSVQDMVRPVSQSGRLTPPGEGTASGREQRHRGEFRVKDRHSRGWGCDQCPLTRALVSVWGGSGPVDGLRPRPPLRPGPWTSSSQRPRRVETSGSNVASSRGGP